MRHFGSRVSGISSPADSKPGNAAARGSPIRPSASTMEFEAAAPRQHPTEGPGESQSPLRVVRRDPHQRLLRAGVRCMWRHEGRLFATPTRRRRCADPRRSDHSVTIKTSRATPAERRTSTVPKCLKPPPADPCTPKRLSTHGFDHLLVRQWHLRWSVSANASACRGSVLAMRERLRQRLVEQPGARAGVSGCARIHSKRAPGVALGPAFDGMNDCKLARRLGRSVGKSAYGDWAPPAPVRGRVSPKRCQRTLYSGLDCAAGDAQRSLPSQRGVLVVEEFHSRPSAAAHPATKTPRRWPRARAAAPSRHWRPAPPSLRA